MLGNLTPSSDDVTRWYFAIEVMVEVGPLETLRVTDPSLHFIR